MKVEMDEESVKKILHEALLDAAAWGCTYGPALSLQQWHETVKGAVEVRVQLLLKKLSQ